MNREPAIIYVVRHGESEYNRDGILSGQVDPSLTDKGRRQARRTKQALKDVRFDMAYSSDLQRAAKTAEIIFGKPIHPSRQLVGLRERTFGSIDGKSEKTMDGVHEKMLAMSDQDSWQYKHVPDMESDAELSLRFVNELEKLAKNHPGEIILVGAHGGTARSMLMRLKKLAYKDFPRKSFQNGDYIKLTYDGKKLKVEDIVRLGK